MTETEQLREAITKKELNNALNHSVFMQSGYEPIMKAAQAYLSLLEQHPGIQGLIAGTHWIAPNEPTEKMIHAAMFSEGMATSKVTHESSHFKNADPIILYQAMRNAAKGDGK